MKTPYADIIHLPRHVSQNHPQMPMLDRAAQFVPFAALAGYEATVGRTARLNAEKRELGSQEAKVNASAELRNISGCGFRKTAKRRFLQNS